MAGLTANGFETKSIAEIQEEQYVEIASSAGVDINTNPESVISQYVNPSSEVFASLWSLAQAIYQNNNVATVAGKAQDNLYALNKVFRLPATFGTIADVEFTGTTGVTIPAGTVIMTDNVASVKYKTDTTTVLTAGSANIACTAVESGAGQFVATGSTFIFQTPILNITAITSNEDSILGREIETDSEFRIRRNTSLSTSLAGPINAIRKSVLDLNNDTTKTIIDAVFVVENDSDEDDAQGRPPGSFETYVYTSDTTRYAEIAEAIANSRSAGIKTVGDITRTVTDAQGYEKEISFSLPSEVAISVELTISTDSSYPGSTYLKEQISIWGNALGVGVDVRTTGYNSLEGFISTIPGIVSVTSSIGVGGTGDSEVEIDDGSTGGIVEISTWDTSDITIV